MNTYTEKTKENKGQSVAKEVSKHQADCESACQFIDKRSEGITQRKLQVLASTSKQMKRFSAFQAIADCSQQTNQIDQFRAIKENDFVQKRQAVQEEERKAGLLVKINDKEMGTHSLVSISNSPPNPVLQAYNLVKDTYPSWDEDWRMAKDDSMLVHDEDKPCYATVEKITEGENILKNQNSAAKLSQGAQLPSDNNPGKKVLFQVEATQRSGGALGIGQDCGMTARQVMGIHGEEYYSALSKPKGSLKQISTKGRAYMGGALDTTHLWTKEILLRAFNVVGVVPVTPSTAKSLQLQLEKLDPVTKQKVLDEAGINENAIPEIGQGIVISSLSMNTGEKWNFHFGTAIMKSGEDYTTLENDASQPNPQSWYFRMFGPASKGQTFYQESKDSGDFGTTPIAMLLDPKSSVDRNNVVLKQNVEGFWRKDNTSGWKRFNLLAHSTVEIIHDKSPIDQDFSEVRVKLGRHKGVKFLVSHDENLIPATESVKAEGEVLVKDVNAYWWDSKKNDWSTKNYILKAGSRVAATDLVAPYSADYVELKVIEGKNMGFTFAVQKADVNI